jgi:pyrimidine-nucleoside phosphorylase
VTGTVPSIPLIASSIMSKKLAAGASVIVLDVKTGSGAFLRERDSALMLAKMMIDIGAAAGRRMAAVVSDMSQPLGRAVGNALEVAEALDTLDAHGPPDFTEFVVDIASTIVELASEGQTGRAEIERALRSGDGRQALRRMVEAQGGDAAAFDERARLPTARLQRPVLSQEEGYVARLDALSVARASIALGAGRERKGDPIDLAVGVVLEAKLGDRVTRGQPIAVLHANDEGRLAQAERVLRSAFGFSRTTVEPPPVILERLATAPSAAVAPRA